MALADDGRLGAYVGRRETGLAALASRAAGLRALRHLGFTGLAALMLLWSALANGHPSVFPDTALYYSEAAYFSAALGFAPPPTAPSTDPTALPHTPGAPNVSATIDGARSPVYGLFIFTTERLGGLWLCAAAQALILALSLRLLVRATIPAAPDWLFLAWVAVLAACSSLSYFTSFIMPDVFAGVAGIGVLLVLVHWDRLSTPSRVATLGLLVFSMAVHRANLLIVVALAPLGAGVLTTLGAPLETAARRAGLLLLGAVGAMALTAVIFLPIRQSAGEPIRNPPFLMARVLADGPGRRFLAFACSHGQRFTACRFRALPPETSDTLLWSSRRGVGLFGAADYRTRLRLETEEPSLVLSTLAYDPVGELRSSANNVWRQLSATDVQSPLSDPHWLETDGYWKRTSLPRIFPDARGCRRVGACASRLSPAVVNELQRLTLLVSELAAEAAVIWLTTRPGVLRSLLSRNVAPVEYKARHLRQIALVAVLIALNAVVCGAFSAPAPRYEARLIWLLPAVASLAWLSLLGSSTQVSALQVLEHVRRKWTPVSPPDLL